MTATTEASITAWIETELNGRVLSIARQPRWRPVWFVDAEIDGKIVPLCVRGERSDTTLVFALDHEMRLQRGLHDHDIPVPEVYGWIDDPAAYVMDRVPGRPDFGGVPPVDRDRIIDEYLQVLARIHALPTEPFRDDGILGASASEGSSMFGLGQMESVYRSQKRHPDPFLEWALGWVHRHPPQSHGRESVIVWDSGQIHHDGQHLVAVLDVEIGHIGDPMMDLAAWRMRDSVIPFGDFNRLYARYGELAGAEVDIEAIERHHIAFTLSNQLAFSHTLRELIPGCDLPTNMQWCNETNLYATEAIADYMGMELPEVEAPDARPSRGHLAIEHLVRSLGDVDVADPVTRFGLRSAFRLARHIARADEIGDELTSADIDDVEHLLGRRTAGWLDADEQLERFVLADRDTGRYDEVLLTLFHRRGLRAQMLNGPAGSAMARHNEIQRFPRRAR